MLSVDLRMAVMAAARDPAPKINELIAFAATDLDPAEGRFAGLGERDRDDDDDDDDRYRSFLLAVIDAVIFL